MAHFDVKLCTVLAVVFLSMETDGFLFHSSPFGRMNQNVRHPSPQRVARDPRYQSHDSWGRRRDPWGRQVDPWGRRTNPWGHEADQRGRHQEDPRLRQTDQWSGPSDTPGHQPDSLGRQADPRARRTDQWGRQAAPRERQADQWDRQDNSREAGTHRQRTMGQNAHKRPSSTNREPHRPQRATRPTTEITRLKVSGYDPEDILISLPQGGPIEVKGLHRCDCRENCLEREFERKVQLPRGFDPRTLQARISDDEYLIISGVRQQSSPLEGTTKLTIPVEGNGRMERSRTGRSGQNCGDKKQGFKLKKMDPETRQIVDDVPVEVVERRYEGEIDNDGVTIEVDS